MKHALLPIAALIALSGCQSQEAPATNSPAEIPGMAGVDHNQVTPTGDADRDFAMMMIEHHRGAVTMSRDYLTKGKSPEMRALAQQIIAAQQPEIDQMQGFLAKPAEGAR